ncbi:MAG: amidohydrolase [Chlorobi bacterium]|nr:amidohydrolase [Chlorobiota bacterium]
MQDLKILCFQSDLVWEDPEKNRELFGIKILNHFEGQDLIMLPETFTTGFPVDPSGLAETPEGETVRWMSDIARETGAVITGSLLLEANGKYTNSLIWMRPDGTYERYDKRHVFSMGGEHEKITPGKKQLIVELKGWRIRPMICYDLRFPVWCKNRLNETGRYEYDLSLFVANWPNVRSYPWEQLLIARAIENLAYVVGLNRIGHDGPGNYYSGDSLIIDPKGKIISRADEGKERAMSEILSYNELAEFRKKFDVGRDWDEFEINLES